MEGGGGKSAGWYGGRWGEECRVVWREVGGRVEGGMEGGGGKRDIINTYRYNVTIRMTPALRWATMRAISMLHEL